MVISLVNLQQLETFDAERILIAYAASPGKGVDSSSERNSHYTKQLLHFIKQPLPIELVLKNVRTAVKKKTEGLQVPWYMTSIPCIPSLIKEGTCT